MGVHFQLLARKMAWGLVVITANSSHRSWRLGMVMGLSGDRGDQLATSVTQSLHIMYFTYMLHLNSGLQTSAESELFNDTRSQTDRLPLCLSC